MNLIQPISIAAACFLALSACASAPPPHRASGSAAKVPPPAASDSTVQPAAAPDSAAPDSAAKTGATDPYGTDQAGGQQVSQGSTINAPQQANAETTEGVVVLAPDGTVWSRGGGANSDYQGDVDSCYAYARGQVDHDARIESDVASAFDSGSGSDGLGLTALRGRMSHFERHNRVPALFNSCMIAKGYDRQ
jgi:hypothetical protein